MATEEAQRDLQAAVAARRDLGPEYESEIIDGFLDKLDARVAERAAEVARQTPPAVSTPSKDDPQGLALAIVSISAGVPITAIAADQEGLAAIFVCWGGLVGINLARSISRFVGR